MRGRTAILAVSVSALPFLSLQALAAGALPNGGNFATGAGKFSSSATSLTVNQTSKSGIINWSSFSIGSGNSVQINNGGGATLNRVTGNSLSTIEGSLTSNGSVYLINQNGILVTPTGQILTSGNFIASTRDSNSSDVKGVLRFTGSSGGTVDNEGTISAGRNVVLVGKSATNGGSITAAKGIAALVAGDDVILKPNHSGLEIQVNAGSGDATNSGSIMAAQAMLNAVGGNVYALAGTNSLISATGTSTINGHVWLTAGGAVDVEGPVSAQNADVTISGAGTAAQPVGVTINSVIASSGNVTVTGTGYAGTTPTSSYGVEIGGAILAGGSVTVTGEGGNNGAPEATSFSDNPLDPCVPGICNYGVVLNGGAIESTGAGSVTVTGTGGGAGGSSFGNDGVFNGLGQISANGGAINITGTGGSTTGPSNFGVTNEGYILNAGNGSITITGTSGAGGPGAEVSPLGIGQVGVANLGLIQTGTGNISIIGNVGANSTGAGNFGVGLGGGAVLTGGNGNINIVGTSNGAFGSNAGVLMMDFGFGPPVVAAADGNITITGTNLGTDADGDFGVLMQTGTVATSGTGNIVVTGNAPGAGNLGEFLGGTIVAGGTILLQSPQGPIVNTGALIASGSGVAITVIAPQGFLDSGTDQTPNGTEEVNP